MDIITGCPAASFSNDLWDQKNSLKTEPRNHWPRKQFCSQLHSDILIYWVCAQCIQNSGAKSWLCSRSYFTKKWMVFKYLNILTNCELSDMYFIQFTVSYSIFILFERLFIWQMVYSWYLSQTHCNLIFVQRMACHYFWFSIFFFLTISSGVPKGSVFGPILFLLFMDDLADGYCFTFCNLLLFADDCKLFR